MASDPTTAPDTAAETAIVDCDLHVYPDAEDEIAARLPRRYAGKGVSAPAGNWTSPIDRTASGPGVAREAERADPERTIETHLDGRGIDRAVLVGGRANLRATALPDVRYASALTRAYNDWLIDAWLERDDRFYGSISVAPHAPEEAAEEIDRLGDHSQMVQVVVSNGTQIPLGQEKYWPIYRAAEAAGLPVAIHAGSAGYGVSHANSGAGYPSTEAERRTVEPCNFMGQLLSVVLEGVPVEFPDLRVVLIGSGFSWLPSFLWRVDKCWKGPSQDNPWVQRPPSEYVYETMRIVDGDLGVADSTTLRREMLELSRAEELLMYGSNFPHWDYAAPDADRDGLSDDFTRAFYAGNATSTYAF